MSENGKMFRTAMGGFNKDDVNRYILEMDRKHKEKTENLEKDLEAKAKECDFLSAKIEEMKGAEAEKNSRLSELEEELARLKEENRVLTESKDELGKKGEFFKIQTETLDKELSRERDEKNTLNERIAALTEESHAKDAQIKQNAEKYAADIETLRSAYENEIRQAKDAAKLDEGAAYKLDMYDRISSQIGDILINANRSSDEIITSARNEAEKLLNQTNADAAENAKRMQDGIHACAVSTAHELKNDFSTNVGSCISEIRTCISDIQYETDALMSFLKRKQEEINERLDFCHSSISENVEEKISNMAAECGEIIDGGNGEAC